jgi:hypothetical protein
MKKVIKVTEVEGEGLEGLLGQRVLIMTAGYFYEGELEGVNTEYVKLADPHIVYETGSFSDKIYKDIQKLHKDEWYVHKGLIESFGVSKND